MAIRETPLGIHHMEGHLLKKTNCGKQAFQFQIRKTIVGLHLLDEDKALIKKEENK